MSDPAPAAAVSQHAVDRLIRELSQTDREATPAEVDQIIERMATAPFDSQTYTVRTKHRGLTYLERSLGPREPSLFYHLVKRVVAEEQWAYGTTESEYLTDLRDAVRSAAARLVVYARRGGSIAVTLTPTSATVPPERRTPASLPLLLVVYSADRGMMISGYQISGLETAGIPQEARWLK
ncbi:MAG: hypothetical protein ACRDJN_15575 [Chloroflexota bacterium]